MLADVGLGTRGAGVTSGMYDWSWRRLAPLMLVMRQDFCLKVLHECFSVVSTSSMPHLWASCFDSYVPDSHSPESLSKSGSLSLPPTVECPIKCTWRVRAKGHRFENCLCWQDAELSQYVESLPGKARSFRGSATQVSSLSAWTTGRSNRDLLFCSRCHSSACCWCRYS